MKKRFTKKLLSMLTALLLVVSMLAVNVYADTDGLPGEPAAVEAEQEVSVDEAVPEAADEIAAEEDAETVLDEAADVAADEAAPEASEEEEEEPEAVAEASETEEAEETEAPEAAEDDKAAVPVVEETSEAPEAEEKAEPEKAEVKEEAAEVEKANAEGAVPIAITACTKIGYHEDFEADIYYFNIGTEETLVELTDFAGKMEGGTISGLKQTGYLGDTNVVDLNDGFGIDKDFLMEQYGEYLDETAVEGLELSNIYGLFVMDADFESTLFIIQGKAPEATESSFTLDKGTVVSFEEDAYSYTDWAGTTRTMDLYTVSVPFGTAEVNLGFEEELLAYAYEADGSTYIASCGAEGDGDYANNGQTGQKAAKVRGLGDGSLPPYVYVQTPYDESWNSTNLYAIKFVQTHQFTASYNGTELTDIVYTPDVYTYLDYMTGQNQVAGVFTITIPNEAESIDFVVTDSVLHYNYTKEGEFLGGWVTNFQEGDKEFTQSVDYGDDTTKADGIIDYIQIQTPYDAAYNSTLLYVVTFLYENPQTDPGQKPEDIAESVAQVYTNVSDAQNAFMAVEEHDIYSAEWIAMELARAGYEVPDAYYLDVFNTVYAKEGKLSTNQYDYTNYAKVILALTAGGKDPRDVAGYNLVAALADYDAVAAQGLNGVIYALLALDSGNYDIPAAAEGTTQATRENYIAAILEAQHADGGWAYGADEASDPDMTAMALQALAPYYHTGDGDIRVKKAIDKALNLLSSMQTAEGTFKSEDAAGEPTSESTAQVIVALAALGINPDTDARFVKGEVSAIDGLCSFWTDGGFKHIASGTLNAFATTQGYYALVSYYRLLEGKTSLYDMTDMELSLIGADYSAVDAALEKVPADLSVYTEETAAAVTAAVEQAADRSKLASEQAAVDAIAAAIESAVKALKVASFEYDGTTIQFIKKDGSAFGMWTPKPGSTFELDGEEIHISIIPSSTKRTYGWMHWGGINEELTKDVEVAADGKIILTVSTDLCGWAVPVAPIKASDATATTSSQYYLAIPDKSAFTAEADYTIVEEAIAAIPEDLSVYTEDSVADVTAAVEAVDYTKTAVDQLYVNAMAEAIETAVKNLIVDRFAYDGTGIQFIKKDGSPFGMWTPQPGSTFELDGEEIHISIIPSSTKRTYGWMHWGGINEELTKDVEVAADGKIILTVSTELCGWAVPVAPIKASDATATTSSQYYLAIPDKSAFTADADYTIVDEALAKVPAEQKNYTAASVKTLKEAVDNVVRGLKAAEQAVVNGMADKIEKAIKGLEEKEFAFTVDNKAADLNATLTVTMLDESGETPETISIQDGDRFEKGAVVSAAVVNDSDKMLSLKALKTADGSVLQECLIQPGGAFGINGLELNESATFVLDTTTVKIEKAALKATSFAYKGAAIKPAIKSVTATINGETVTLTKDTDYTVSYSNNTKAGTGKVTIKGKGNYTGTITKTFTITPVKLSSATLKYSVMYYTGKARTQSTTVVVKAKVNGKTVTLTRNTDFKVSYKNNTNVGIATVTFTGKGNFTGTIKKTFQIRPKTTALKSVTSTKAKQAVVKWNKQDAQITGYQIMYGTNKSFKANTYKTVKVAKGNYTKTLSKLTSGKTYYFKIRTYKTVSGKTYYSKWSAVKSVKVK